MMRLAGSALHQSHHKHLFTPLTSSERSIGARMEESEDL